MANHEKVFGICENKCLVEVSPKTDTDGVKDIVNKKQNQLTAGTSIRIDENSNISFKIEHCSISPRIGTITFTNNMSVETAGNGNYSKYTKKYFSKNQMSSGAVFIKNDILFISDGITNYYDDGSSKYEMWRFRWQNYSSQKSGVLSKLNNIYLNKSLVNTNTNNNLKLFMSDGTYKGKFFIGDESSISDELDTSITFTVKNQVVTKITLSSDLPAWNSYGPTDGYSVVKVLPLINLSLDCTILYSPS